jgi:predicted lipoprotein with Yx(FWY)xxD motif
MTLQPFSPPLLAPGRRRARGTALGVAAVAVVMLAAGCGSSSAGSATVSPPASGAAAGSGGGATVRTASLPGVGTVLVDSAGRTLYLLGPDQHHRPTCTGGCAAVWPPLLSSAPVGAGGVSAALLGTVSRGAGQTQVTYHGWPLYTYVADSGPGQDHGQGITSFGGSWSTLTVAGTRPAATAASPSASPSAGGGGYGY